MRIAASDTINSWKDKVYISDNETFEADRDRLFGEFEHTNSLAVGETKEIAININLPEDLIGNKHILIVSDADNDLKEAIGEDNNAMTTPYADLQITQINTSGEANSGDPLTISWTVANEGIGITSSSFWFDRLSLATDPEGNNIIADLGSFEQARALAVGSSYNRSVNVTLPEGIEGSHYIVAKTGGPFEFVYNDNNTIVSNAFNVNYTPAPDLTITDIIAPEAIQAGQKIDLSWTVTNEGIGEAVESWTDSIYLQEVGNPDARLIPLKSYRYDRGLESGKSYTRQEKITMPGELQGLYQVVVKTNFAARSDLFEPNKDNNKTIDDGIITLSLPPRPDLQVSSIIAPDRVSAGGLISGTFK